MELNQPSIIQIEGKLSIFLSPNSFIGQQYFILTLLRSCLKME